VLDRQVVDHVTGHGGSSRDCENAKPGQDRAHPAGPAEAKGDRPPPLGPSSPKASGKLPGPVPAAAEESDCVARCVLLLAPPRGSMSQCDSAEHPAHFQELHPCLPSVDLLRYLPPLRSPR